MKRFGRSQNEALCKKLQCMFLEGDAENLNMERLSNLIDALQHEFEVNEKIDTNDRIPYHIDFREDYAFHLKGFIVSFENVRTFEARALIITVLDGRCSFYTLEKLHEGKSLLVKRKINERLLITLLDDNILPDELWEKVKDFEYVDFGFSAIN